LSTISILSLPSLVLKMWEQVLVFQRRYLNPIPNWIYYFLRVKWRLKGFQMLSSE
jgi:hypothetical protein